MSRQGRYLPTHVVIITCNLKVSRTNPSNTTKRQFPGNTGRCVLIIKKIVSNLKYTEVTLISDGLR